MTPCSATHGPGSPAARDAVRTSSPSPTNRSRWSIRPPWTAAGDRRPGAPPAPVAGSGRCRPGPRSAPKPRSIPSPAVADRRGGRRPQATGAGPDLLAVPAQHPRPQGGIGHQLEQPFHGSVDVQGADRLDGYAPVVAERDHRVPAARRGAGQDPADRVVAEGFQQPFGLLLASGRQRTVVVGAGPPLLAAGMGVADEVRHSGLPSALDLLLGTVPNRISWHKRCPRPFSQSSSDVPTRARSPGRRAGGASPPGPVVLDTSAAGVTLMTLLWVDLQQSLSSVLTSTA